MSTYENEWITLSALPVSLVAGKLSQLLSDRFGFAQDSWKRVGSALDIGQKSGDGGPR